MISALLQPTGARAIHLARYALDLARFFARMWVTLLSGGVSGARVVSLATFKQVYFTGVGAVPVVVGLALVFGAVIMIQTPAIVSDGGKLVGTLMDLVIIRQLAPLMTAFIVIGRSGSAITVELGNMKVHGEIDTLDALGIDPVRYLAVPRMVGVVWAVLCLCLIFDVVAMLGGYAVASAVITAPPASFLATIAERLTASALIEGLVKSALFGLVISAVSIYQGFTVTGSTTEVPQATSRAIVHALVLCVVIDLLVTLLFGRVSL